MNLNASQMYYFVSLKEKRDNNNSKKEQAHARTHSISNGKKMRTLFRRFQMRAIGFFSFSAVAAVADAIRSALKLSNETFFFFPFIIVVLCFHVII